MTSDGIFQPLVGHSGAKAILRSSLRQGTVHVLLSGPPASGKSVALLAIEDAVPNARYVEGRGLTERKLRDILSENPAALLLDEFDNMIPAAYHALNTALEQGRVTKSVTGEEYDYAIDTQVVAACNDHHDAPRDVRDRFVDVPFEAYDRGEFIDVCEVLLPQQVPWVEADDAPAETARDIADTVWRHMDTRSPRKARDAARLAGAPGRVEPIVHAMTDPKADVDSEPLYPDELPHHDHDPTPEAGDGDGRPRVPDGDDPRDYYDERVVAEVEAALEDAGRPPSTDTVREILNSRSTTHVQL
jgi:nucleotide-binding universal stress UspA family protein